LKAIPNNRRRSKKSGSDYFPTPPWATRALCRKLAPCFDLASLSALDPACGGGHMSAPLGEYFESVRSTDLYDYSAEFAACEPGHDFISPSLDPEIVADWIITNPPFVIGEAFLKRALSRARVGVAFFVKVQFLEGISRFLSVYNVTPPSAVFQFAERVPLVTGKLDPKAATNQSYIWVVFVRDPAASLAFSRQVAGPALGWIAPSRRALERQSDYPAPDPAPQSGIVEGWVT
jgi:hypothetical protein